MKLEFDSVSDLQDFLDWSLRYGAAWASLQRGPSTAAPAAAPLEPYPTIDTSGVAFDTPPAALTATPPDAGCDPATEAAKEQAGKVPEQASEPTKRKRRTKAEIEADEKRIAVDALARQVADGNRKEFAEEVAVAYAKGDEKAAEPAAQPEGTNPFEQAATPAAEAASPAADPADPVAGEESIVTPFQHLTRAREFIGKHGMPKYNESFAKAGLDPNVMAYTGYQRALHIDALDALEAA